MPNALNDLLQATLRSFYLTLRVLPARVRPQIGLAYRLTCKFGHIRRINTMLGLKTPELVPAAIRAQIGLA